jgi:hypothetical protein
MIFLVLAAGCVQQVRDLPPVAAGADGPAPGTTSSDGGTATGSDPGPTGSDGGVGDRGGAPIAGTVDAGSACNAGETRCGMGATVEVCTVTGNWTVKESCRAVCAAGACAGSCTPMERHCGADQTPESCNAQGEWIRDPQPCPNVCTGHGVCGGDCKPATKRCAGGDGLTPETCNEEGKWAPGVPCPNICSSGTCGGSCMPRTLRCGPNNTPQTCSGMGTWEPGAACPFVCSGAGLCTGECKPRSKKCAGNVPQQCDDNGAWQAKAACPNVCADGACTGDCTPNDRRCTGKTAQVCDDTGRWITAMSCPFLCTGKGQCSGECQPGTMTCTGTPPTQRVCQASATFQDERCPAPSNGAAVCNGTRCDYECPSPAAPFKCAGNKCCECTASSQCTRDGFIGDCRANRCAFTCDITAHNAWTQSAPTSPCTQSSWSFTGSNASLTGSETGCAGATGRGRYANGVLALDFEFNGVESGHYDWMIDPATCDPRGGTLIFNTGTLAGMSFPSSLRPGH